MTNKKQGFSLSSRLADHLVNAIFIFTSVFLAFWLTDWRDTKNREKLLEASLKQIASEMAFNHERIETTYQYHLNVTRQIDSLRRIEGSNWQEMHGFALKGWNGLGLTVLRSTAYQTFLNTGISDVATLEQAKALADIYNAQSIVERFDNSTLDFATRNKNFTSLLQMRHTSGIYTEILPEVIHNYQQEGKPWLKAYGYALDVEEEALKKTLANWD